MLLPLPVRLVDGKALEQPEPGGEERFQGRDHERLAEPTRTLDEEELGPFRRHKTVNEFRLVNVNATLSPQGREVVRICGYWSHRPIFYHNCLWA